MWPDGMAPCGGASPSDALNVGEALKDILYGDRPVRVFYEGREMPICGVESRMVRTIPWETQTEVTFRGTVLQETFSEAVGTLFPKVPRGLYGFIQNRAREMGVSADEMAARILHFWAKRVEEAEVALEKVRDLQ